MNRSKRIMLIIVIIVNILSAIGTSIFLAFEITHMPARGTPGYEGRLISIIYDCISLAGFVASSGCLAYAISNKGQFFRSRNGYYMSAVIISLCMSLFSLSSVLLVISLFMTDMVWVRPQDDVYFQGEDVNAPPKPEEEMSEAEKERKIARLRQLRDKGTITEEEFKDELMKLL